MLRPDANDITVSTLNFNHNIFKILYDSLTGGNLDVTGVTAIVLQIWTIYSIFAFIVSALFIAGLIYAFIRYNELGELDHQRIHDEEHRWQELHGAHLNVGNERWHSVQHHMESENPNDWKLAIIEADVLLERALEHAGYAGATIADKLKSASVRSFHTIDDAWQAHRVRNQIAHGGSDFVLTQKAAKETLIMYERVFKEFGTFESTDDGHGHGGGHH